MVWLVTEALDEIADEAYVCGKDMKELRMQPGEAITFKGGLSW